MTQQLGETREAMAIDCWRKAEAIAHDKKNDVKPFYIIYSAKPDPNLSGAVINGNHVSGGIRECWRISYERPPFILGMLVWFVNNPLGIFQFVSELSSPPDIPLDPSLLSNHSQDQFSGVMQKGKDINVLVS